MITGLIVFVILAGLQTWGWNINAKEDFGEQPFSITIVLVLSIIVFAIGALFMGIYVAIPAIAAMAVGAFASK